MQEFGSATITRADDADTLQFDWGTLKMLSDPHSSGAERFSFGMVSIQPGDGHARHNHPDSDEVIFVVAGTGTQMLNDEDPADIGPGDCIYIPKGMYHATQNTGWEAMKLIIVYAPAGPEDVLRGMDDCTIVPPGQTPA